MVLQWRYGRGESSLLTTNQKKNQTTEALERNVEGHLLSSCESGNTTDSTSDDFFSNRDNHCAPVGGRDAIDVVSNEKRSEKQKHSGAKSGSIQQSGQPRSISLSLRRRFLNREDSIEKQDDSQESLVGKSTKPAFQRRSMSQRKCEAVAASIALKERKELEEKRRKTYAKALGPLRMEFVDCGSYDTDGDSFFEEFEAFIDEKRRGIERKEKAYYHSWGHFFENESNPAKKKDKKKKKKKKQIQELDESTSLKPSQSNTSSQGTHLTVVRSLNRQYASFAKNLPVLPEGAIFVRAPENRLDLPRILITGPHETPYANGVFFFDCWTKDYPNSAPKLQFLTTGRGTVRFNPNLYASGKVCLSLLGTWAGPGWISGKSTLLQLLLSCQGLVLGTDEPFYNEPGYESHKGGPKYKRESTRYNKEIRKVTLKWAILYPLKQIVDQEYRVEERKRFLEKLKQQRQKERARSLTNSSAPISTNENTKKERGSKKKKKKLKWLWSPSASAQTRLQGEDRDEPKLMPNRMPSRAVCDYPEFTSVIIEHFVNTADHLEEQLQSWHELDPKGTKKYVEEIRSNLKRLIYLVETRKEAKEKDGDHEPKNRDATKKVK